MQALSQLSYGPGVTENEIIARHAGQHKLFFTKISEGLEALPDLGESLLQGRLWLDGAGVSPRAVAGQAPVVWPKL